MLDKYGKVRAGGAISGVRQKKDRKAEMRVNRRTDDRESSDRLEAVPSDCQVNQ